ncbi:MAG: carboxypeptidase-like regulatory domain-containing protein, partial [Chloroflexota bacterium]|nr:carboxypeptidase-like regulatory domain-containing protein [Chloroflexota bacterium]
QQLEIRRAAYRDAHLRGDPLETIRAAARLRAHVTELDAAELAAVRASRQRFGQAIREARARRVLVPGRWVDTSALPLSRPFRFPFVLAASLAVLAMVLIAVVAQPLLADQTEGGSGAPAAVATDPVVVDTQSRGRVVLAVTVAPAAEPVTTAPPEASASASPGPTSGAVAVGGTPNPSGSGGAGTGTGTGTGGGTASASPSPRPSPTASRSPGPSFAVCSASVPSGFARLCGLVVDAQTGRPIAGACASLGPCNDQSTRTDPNGRWTFTLPVGDGTLEWDLEFAMTGYVTSQYAQTSRQGFITVPTQRLVAQP